VVQQNIEHIRDGAKSHHEDTQQAAMDVLAFTVNQALYHPLAVRTSGRPAGQS
jgi:cohesin loading factor subunit SCC2